MSTLFEVEDSPVAKSRKPAAQPTPAADLPPVRMATPEQVEALTQFMFPADIVVRWTYERAGLKLRELTRKRDWSIRRANSLAARQDAHDSVPFPPVRWLDNAIREDAAVAIEQAGADDGELAMAVSHAVLFLDADELRRLAKHFVTKFRSAE